MDPVTQGIVGATASQLVSKSTQFKVQAVFVTLLGFLSAMAADLDVLIRSETDPLLFLQFHRHFTHSLIFIPVGGLLTAAVFYLLLAKRRALSFQYTWLLCTAAYATHALLDACTSYGTQLLWPISNTRYAWNNMSIIDPLYTLTIVALVVTAAITRRKKWTYIAVFWMVFYPQLGVIQRERAESAALALAHSRGHTDISGLSVKPSLGNLILWKSIYEHKQRFYVDAVRAGTTTTIYTGSSIQKLADTDNLSLHYPWLNPASQQAKDIARFRWFSQGYVAQNPDLPMQIMDMRYSAIPNQIKPLWSIELSEAAADDQHAAYIMNEENRKDAWPEFIRMLKGQ